ncbi:MAG: hypothetical protein P9L97_06395 [Candidatus Tenebribacter davisii]|nr:hypothetical protein [Candidatus Tenebribacter davisii]
MRYNSVDKLQKYLQEKVFSYTQSPKKAAGRALGTIVEIITFYLLKSWGLENSISIEKKVPEFGFPEITHNVEFSLHPVLKQYKIEIDNDGSSITSTKLINSITSNYNSLNLDKKSNNNLLSKDGTIRNACTIGTSEGFYLVATINKKQKNKYYITINKQWNKPYCIFECKRVGIEEGCKKGPQTIEKAKQGAYVAKTVSSLQKVRLPSGELYGIIYKNNQIVKSEPYYELLNEVIKSNQYDFLEDFILTVGVVSNHGNWFTAENHNKELKVLAQAYDWLLFLTDEGITSFISDVILESKKEYSAIKNAFHASYNKDKKGSTQFTKVKMNSQADSQLTDYFIKNKNKIANWFNLISPDGENVTDLLKLIDILNNKEWSKIIK